MSVAARLGAVRARIGAAAERAGRNPAAVRLVTVTKGHPLERVEEAIAAGATLLGENRLEEAELKIPALKHAPVEWHMIGHLQSRKAKRVGTLFQLIHSLDQAKTLAILGQQRRADDPQEILLEVNLSGEASKHGVGPGVVRALLDAALAEPGVRVRGLMTMAPAAPDPEAARPVFAGLRDLRDRLQEEYGDRCRLEELSMGMTGDFEVAVEEGATLVRVGTAIMGERHRG